MDKHKLRLILFDILKGYSKTVYNKKDIYIKHHSNLDLGDIEERRQEAKLKAETEGLPTFEYQQKYIIDQGLWSKEKDEEIDRIKFYISNLNKTKSKLFKEIDLKSIQSKIDQESKRLLELVNEKKEFIGLTSEDFSTKKANEYYIYISYFYDKNLTKNFFSKEEFNELENNDLRDLVLIYNSTISSFDTKNLKKIALSPTFLTLFNASNDNIYNLYGKPLINLTMYQIEVFGYAKYFKSIISDAKHKPPDDYYEDPDKLIEWLESSRNAEEVLSKSENTKNKNSTVATSIVGASKKDLEKIGGDSKDGVNLHQEALKKGGKLSMEDLIKLHKS